MRTVFRAMTICVLVAGSLAASAASELRQFHAAVASADDFYRSALFYLRTGNAMVAGFELQQMREAWSSVQKRFAADPPDAYSDDASFAPVIGDVAVRIDRAAAAAAAGDAEGAREVLEPVRGSLAQLRKRAGVRVFSDCIDDVEAAMDVLYVYRKEPPDLADSAQVNRVKSAAAVLDHLLRRCDADAVSDVRDDLEFRRLVDGSTQAVDSLFLALDRKDRTAVINVLRELRSFCRILFLRFG